MMHCYNVRAYSCPLGSRRKSQRLRGINVRVRVYPEMYETVQHLDFDRIKQTHLFVLHARIKSNMRIVRKIICVIREYYT